MRGGDIALLVILVALAGAGVAQVQGLVLAFGTGTDLPDSGLFRGFFVWVWLPAALLALASGLGGGYRSIRDGNLRSPFLIVFLTIFSLVVQVDGYELGWSYLRVAVNLRTEPLGVGVNVVGLALLWWLVRARAKPPSTLVDPQMSSDGAEGRESSVKPAGGP